MYGLSVVLFAIVSISFAQDVGKGRCPSVRVVQPFTPDKFEGKWIQWARFPSQIESETKCNAIDFTFKDGGVDLHHSFINSVGKASSLEGSAILPKPVGQFNVTLPQIDIESITYSILGTDYERWAALYACRNLKNNQYQQILWFLTRTKCASAADIAAIRKAVLKEEMSLVALEPVEQKKC